MKPKALFAGLIAVLGLVSWLGGSSAGARPVCDSYVSHSCTTPGSTINCTWMNGLQGQCVCADTGWTCYYWTPFP